MLKRRKKNKTLYVTLLILTILCAAIAYATFNDVLTISGTATATGNFDLVFSSAEIGEQVGNDNSASISIDNSDHDTITLDTGTFNSVNGHVTYLISIHNESPLKRAKVEGLTFSGLDSNSVYEVSGYNSIINTILDANDNQVGGSDEVSFTLTVGIKSGTELGENVASGSFTVSVEYVEATASEVAGITPVGSSVSAFETALAGVSSHGTVTLTENVDLTDAYAKYAGHIYTLPNNATLNLNGSTITSLNQAVIYSGNNLTIKNGNFVGVETDTTNASYALFVGGKDTLMDSNVQTTNTTISNCTFTGGINTDHVYNVVLENCVVNGTKYYTVFGNSETQITINSGTYTAGTKALLGMYGVRDVSDDAAGNDNGAFTINGGTFITNGQAFCLTGAKYIEPVVYGGTFDVDVSDYVADGYECIADPNNVGMYIVQQQS